MGLVFYGRQMSERMLAIHKYPTIQQTTIDRRAAQQPVYLSSKPVTQLSPENLLFLKSIGIFKKK